VIFRFERNNQRLTLAVSVILFAALPVLRSQISRPLQWQLEQQPTSVPCTPEELGFVNAPEQVSLEKSYILQPTFPPWKCHSVQASALNQARVLIVYRPSIIDDGEAFSLILPHGSTSVRLLPLGGGLAPMHDEDDWHNLAAMNAILHTGDYGRPETIDWLALCLAYLTILDDAPSLADLHYSPGPADSYFKPYTVPGLLKELPALTRKDLLPTLTCDQNSYCTVHLYYRTEPVEPLKVADFVFHLQDGMLSLLQAKVQNYAPEAGKEQARH
jgi:hypothetical protein